MSNNFHLINGEWLEGSSSDKYTVHNPADDSVIGELNLAGAKEVDAAVAAAREAFENGPRATLPGAKRGALMHKFADLMEANIEKLAKAESRAMGQPIAITTNFLIPGVIACWRHYAGWADKIEGQTFAAEGGVFRYTMYQPYGVYAGISPWNVSLASMAWKMAPAIAAGNTYVFKGSEKSPYAILGVAPLFKEAGFPDGVVNILTGAGQTGALLAAHMDIDKISFTGSGAAGRKVVEAASKSNQKKVTLELGGKSPALVFEDADMEAAIKGTSHFLFNSGQTCTAASRVFVQSSIADKFIETLKAHFQGAQDKMGDPAESSTIFGPVADKAQFERVMGFIETGKSEATLLVGGERKGDKGAFITPTIFLNPRKNSTIDREEIFGPVLSVSTFDTEEQAIKLANDTSYGLAAGVYTSNIARALRVAAKIKAGMVGVNGAYAPDNNMPFGGFKQSGQGRELGKEGLMAYLQSKAVEIFV